MGTEVQVFSAADFALARQNAAAAAGSSGSVGFLKMSRTGEWTMGRDAEDVSGEELLVDPAGFVQGWQCWADTNIKGVQAELQGQALGPLMGPPLPCPEDVYEDTQGWKALLGFSGVLHGTMLTYSATSDGGKKAVFKLLDAIIEQARVRPEKAVPVVRLDCDSYMHPIKTRGEIFIPVFSVVRWVTMTEAGKLIASTKVADKVADKVPAKAAAKKVPVKAARRAA